MKATSFAELTRQVHLLNDLILADVTYGNEEYEEESLNFSKHLLATKYWFARISYANKKRYVLLLLNDVRSAWTLSLLLKAMWNCRPKDAVLSSNECNVWSSYDQVPMDNNRTAQPVKTLVQVMTNDRKWFHTLDPESQAMVLSELVMVAGGPVMWEVLRRAQTLYQGYRDHQLQNLLECIVVNDHVAAEKSKTQQLPSKLKMSQLSAANQSGAGDPDSDNLRPAGHSQRQLEASLATWNATIKSIRDSQKLEEVEMTFNDGTKRKIWKVNRPKPEGIETVDFVQLLPAVIGKRILSFLPRTQLNDYAHVNKYWAYLVDELKAELVARQKLNNDLEKLQELMLKHDTSMDVLMPQPGLSTHADSMATSLAPSVRIKINQDPSVRPSERSTGGMSIRFFMDKLKPNVKNQRPLRNLAELDERLDRRGAADEHLWKWCENVLKQTKTRKQQTTEGLLCFQNMHFPCPLMKKIVQLPLKNPLNKDPVVATSTQPKLKKNIVSAGVLPTHKDQDPQRFHLWSRDFSSLYKVFKVASYDSPV